MVQNSHLLDQQNYEVDEALEWQEAQTRYTIFDDMVESYLYLNKG